MTTGAFLWAFLMCWLIAFVASYIIVEFGQNYLYDETTPGMGWKVALGSFLLAGMLTWSRISFESMLTTDLPWTVLLAIAGFAVFTLVFRFQPLHGAVIGVVSMVILTGLASLAVDSLTSPSRSTLGPVRTPSKPVRRPGGSEIVPSPLAPEPSAPATGATP